MCPETHTCKGAGGGAGSVGGVTRGEAQSGQGQGLQKACEGRDGKPGGTGVMRGTGWEVVFVKCRRTCTGFEGCGWG